MTYLVTGATGFIGRRLVEKLITRRGKIYILVRNPESEYLEALYKRWGVSRQRVVPIRGDLAAPGLGVSDEDKAAMRGKIRHVFHLAAIYDIKADAQSQFVANVEGTRAVVRLAEELKAGCFHHVSSIAAAGLYQGLFREDMFDEAEGLEHPYFRTKHEAEGVVRRECTLPG